MNVLRIPLFSLLALVIIVQSHAVDPVYRHYSPYSLYDNEPSYGFDFDFNNFITKHNGNFQKAFLNAARLGYNDYLKPLLECGALINGYENDGKTALMFAAEYGHLETCRILLQLGAYVDARTNWGSTALMWAAQEGYVHVCKLLLQAGASINAKTHHGKTAYTYAKSNGHHRICSLLRYEPETNFEAHNNYTVSTEYYPTPREADTFFTGCLGVGLIALGSYVLVNSLVD